MQRKKEKKKCGGLTPLDSFSVFLRVLCGESPR